MYFNAIRNVRIYYYPSRSYTSQSEIFKPPWNILFFGTDGFSLASLKALNAVYKQKDIIGKLEVATAVKNQLNPVCKTAKDEGLKIHRWPLNTHCVGFHIGLVASFGYLIPESVITSFPLGMLNVHASLLPRWRGAAPIIHTLANGDKKTGITIMTIKPKHFDIGDIVFQETVFIGEDTTLPQLYYNLANLGAEILVEQLFKLPDNIYSAKPQMDEGVTFATKVTPSFGMVNWSTMPARNVYNLYRALVGLYPLLTTWNGMTVKLYDVHLSLAEGFSAEAPGSVHYDKTGKMLKVQCADGNWIGVKSVGVANKRAMTSSDFNNGYLKKVDVNKRIFT